MKLYPFQEIGVEWLKNRECALLADEQGLGKTVQTVVAVEQLKIQRNLVVCPASLKYVWERTINEWDPDASVQVIQNGKSVIYPDYNWTVLNYDLLLNRDIFMQLLRQIYGVGVFDEAHFLKSADSKRTKLVLLRGGLASRCKRKWFLTGTPILNRPIELYPLLKAAAPEAIAPFTTHIGYAKYFCGGFYDVRGFNDRGATHVEELNQRLVRSGFMLRRLKKDVLQDLPEKTFEIIPVDVSVKKEFEFFWQRDSITKTHLGDYFESDDPNILGRIAGVRQYIALQKLPHVITHIKELMDVKQKVVVFCHHREVAHKLFEGLHEFCPTLLIGGLDAKQKNTAAQDFQNDPKCRIFIGNIAAAGVGLTLTAADTCVFAELDWVPGNMMQAADRIHRIGQKNACLIQMFVTKDTVEEYMLRRLIEKKDICEKVLDNQDSIFS